ncbi:MAG: ROK family protein [Erysipelotrichaceae bacterium]|nr:ROK family protein [Erysipelotrichaceae bacterium]
MLYGGIELGGTKIICGYGDDECLLIDKTSIPTTRPEETLSKVKAYFLKNRVSSLGVASFGPIDLNQRSETYGYIITTPKPFWENTDVLSCFRDLDIPLGFDTDVNGACLGEVKYGAGRGLSNVIYGTIGTGIGFGVYLNDQLLHGLSHPETGHMLIQKHETDKEFHGPCPYHDNCLETLASGPSIEKRYGRKAQDLYENEKVWELESYYLAQAMVNCIAMYSPQKIILGGGVMHYQKLLELTRMKTKEYLNGYIKKEEILNHIDDYIVLPELQDDAGIIGAIELGKINM